MYELTQELIEKAGFHAYEVSNHTKNGAESRHNLIYWNAGDYAGVGPGAHGRITLGQSRIATEAISDPQNWLNSVNTKGTGELEKIIQSNAERADEYLMMGLRLSDGISIQRYNNILGEGLNSNKINYLTDIGMIVVNNDKLATTKAGKPLLNAIIRELLTE